MTFEPKFSYVAPSLTRVCQCKDNLMKAMFCTTGHMAECHFPLNCESAGCSHLEGYGMDPETAAEIREATHALILTFANESCKVCEGTGIMSIKADLSDLLGVPDFKMIWDSGFVEYRTLCHCVFLKIIESLLPNSPIVEEQRFEDE